MSTVYCSPKEQCILSGILPLPSCYLKSIAAAKSLLCKVARAPVLQTSKKKLVYIAKACAVLFVNPPSQGTPLRWPGPKSCFQRAPQGGAESDFAHQLCCDVAGHYARCGITRTNTVPVGHKRNELLRTSDSLRLERTATSVKSGYRHESTGTILRFGCDRKRSQVRAEVARLFAGPRSAPL
jgi:hypothetical protein